MRKHYDYHYKCEIYDDLIQLLSDYENNDGIPVEEEDLYNMLNIIATRWGDLIITDGMLQ